MLIAKIESTPLPDRYEGGWHYLDIARNFGEKPIALESFGRKLAAYRGIDFKVHILDAYCPHMGSDLSKGSTVEGKIICPFHQWQCDADGKCSNIPYGKNIPQRAQIKAWPTLEKKRPVLCVVRR